MEAMFSSIPSIFSVRMESLLETSMRRSESWVSGGLVFLALGGMVAALLENPAENNLIKLFCTDYKAEILCHCRKICSS